MAGIVAWTHRQERLTSPRMKVLCVLSSSNQMYSGIGRAVFELTKRMSDRVEYAFAMSHGGEKNFAILQRFCDEYGLRLHAGIPRSRGDSLDVGNDALPGLLRQEKWDAVECICWANAATNEVVLDHIGDMVLAYTPHDQPAWTVPMSPTQAAHIEDVHSRLLRRADVVFCDSPWERRELQNRLPSLNNCTHISLGCDFSQFEAGPPPRRDQLLFVGDLAEPRKRFDRVLAVFSRLLLHRPSLRLVVVGNRSDAIQGSIPAHLRHACTLRGYVSEDQLRRVYRESAGLLLLSDFEAFGIPILEALASGTPVFLSEQGATESLFAGFRGAHFCPADDLERTLAIIDGTLARGNEGVDEVIRDRSRLQAAFDWDHLAMRKWDALAAAWFKRHAWTKTA